MRARFAALATVLVTSVAMTGQSQAQELPLGTVIVSNMDGSNAWLIDVPLGERRAVIPSRSAPHEVAVTSDGATAVVTNYGGPGVGNLLQFIDVASGSLVRELTIEGRERLHGAAFLPGDSLLVLTSERTSEVLVVSAIDGAERGALGTGGGAPHMLALGGPWVWAANIVGGSVARIDPTGGRPTMTWPAGTRTEGVAATPDGREGWTGSMDTGSVIGVDGESGGVVARITGLGIPYRLAVTPDGATVVVSDPERNRLALIDRHGRELAAEVDVGAAARSEGLGGAPSTQGFTLTPDGVWALVSAKAINRVAVVHLPTRRVVRFLETGQGPDGIAFSPVRGQP